MKFVFNFRFRSRDTFRDEASHEERHAFEHFHLHHPLHHSILPVVNSNSHLITLPLSQYSNNHSIPSLCSFNTFLSLLHHATPTLPINHITPTFPLHSLDQFPPPVSFPLPSVVFLHQTPPTQVPITRWWREHLHD